MANEIDVSTLPAGMLPPGEGAEYAQKMLARAGGVTADNSEKDLLKQNPPVKAPEQTPPPVDHDKRYKDLQAQFTKISQELAEVKKVKPVTETPKPAEKKVDEVVEKPVEAPAAEVPAEAAPAKEIVDKAGLDWNKVNAEFSTDGKLSDESYAALEKAGIPREMVDNYSSGIMSSRKLAETEAAVARTDALSSVGGEEGYSKIVAWAVENMSKEDIVSYNTVVNGKDHGAVKIAIAGLKAKFEAAEGSEPKLISGGPSTGVGYANQKEMHADMKKPEYQTDAAFRAQVARKAAASTSF